MLNEKRIKEGIQQIIVDFKSNYQKYKKDSEASIETKLVEPLFKLLGWTVNDFQKQDRAKREGKTGHADYRFYTTNSTLFSYTEPTN